MQFKVFKFINYTVKRRNKMKSRTVFTIFAVMLVSILMASQALAAGSYYNYNLTVPKLGIGFVTTNNQTKVSAVDTATVCSHSIGAGRTLRASIRNLNGSQAAAYQNISSLQRRNYTLVPSTAGASYHARLASFTWITSDTQAIGWWSPDNPGGCGF